MRGFGIYPAEENGEVILYSEEQFNKKYCQTGCYFEPKSPSLIISQINIQEILQQLQLALISQGYHPDALMEYFPNLTPFKTHSIKRPLLESALNERAVTIPEEKLAQLIQETVTKQKLQDPYWLQVIDTVGFRPVYDLFEGYDTSNPLKRKLTEEDKINAMLALTTFIGPHEFIAKLGMTGTKAVTRIVMNFPKMIREIALIKGSIRKGEAIPLKAVNQLAIDSWQRRIVSANADSFALQGEKGLVTILGQVIKLKPVGKITTKFTNERKGSIARRIEELSEQSYAYRVDRTSLQNLKEFIVSNHQDLVAQNSFFEEFSDIRRFVSIIEKEDIYVINKNVFKNVPYEKGGLWYETEELPGLRNARGFVWPSDGGADADMAIMIQENDLNETIAHELFHLLSNPGPKEQIPYRGLARALNEYGVEVFSQRVLGSQIISSYTEIAPIWSQILVPALNKIINSHQLNITLEYLLETVAVTERVDYITTILEATQEGKQALDRARRALVPLFEAGKIRIHPFAAFVPLSAIGPSGLLDPDNENIIVDPRFSLLTGVTQQNIQVIIDSITGQQRPGGIITVSATVLDNGINTHSSDFTLTWTLKKTTPDNEDRLSPQSINDIQPLAGGEKCKENCRIILPNTLEPGTYLISAYLTKNDSDQILATDHQLIIINSGTTDSAGDVYEPPVLNTLIASESKQIPQSTISAVTIGNNKHEVFDDMKEVVSSLTLTEGTNSIPITIKYSDGSVDYLGYTFNYHPKDKTEKPSADEWVKDPYGECDWDERKVYDIEVSKQTGGRRRITGSGHYVKGECGYQGEEEVQQTSGTADCPSSYPQCGGTAGLEDYPRTDTVRVTPVCDNNGNIIDYKKENLGNKGECL